MILYKQIEQQVNDFPKKDVGFSYTEKVNNCIHHLMGKGDVKVEDLAEALCVSPWSLRRHMLGYVGVKPSLYIMYVRLKTSLEMLSASPRKTVFDIAHECGFVDHSHFTRTFKHYMGQTPQEYQKDILTRIK